MLQDHTNRGLNIQKAYHYHNYVEGKVQKPHVHHQLKLLHIYDQRSVLVFNDVVVNLIKRVAFFFPSEILQPRDPNKSFPPNDRHNRGTGIMPLPFAHAICSVYWLPLASFTVWVSGDHQSRDHSHHWGIHGDECLNHGITSL